MCLIGTGQLSTRVAQGVETRDIAPLREDSVTRTIQYVTSDSIDKSISESTHVLIQTFVVYAPYLSPAVMTRSGGIRAGAVERNVPDVVSVRALHESQQTDRHNAGDIELHDVTYDEKYFRTVQKQSYVLLRENQNKMK